MVNKMKEKTKTQDTDEYKIGIIPRIITFIVVFAILGTIIYFSVQSASKRMTFVSMEKNITTTNIYIEIKNASGDQLKIEDFAILSNGQPLKASKFENGYSYININSSIQTIEVIFNITSNLLDNPITIYFKGKSIQLEKSITF